MLVGDLEPLATAAMETDRRGVFAGLLFGELSLSQLLGQRRDHLGQAGDLGGLQQVPIGPHTGRQGAGAGQVNAGQHQHGRLPPRLLEPLADFKPSLAPRQVDIENHEIGGPAFDQRMGLPPVGGDQDLVPELAQQRPQLGHRLAIVVHHQHGVHHDLGGDAGRFVGQAHARKLVRTVERPTSVGRLSN